MSVNSNVVPRISRAVSCGGGDETGSPSGGVELGAEEVLATRRCTACPVRPRSLRSAPGAQWKPRDEARYVETRLRAVVPDPAEVQIAEVGRASGPKVRRHGRVWPPAPGGRRLRPTDGQVLSGSITWGIIWLRPGDVRGCTERSKRVFVVTHEVREPLPMQGGTTYRFVTMGSRPHSSWPVPPPAWARCPLISEAESSSRSRSWLRPHAR